MPNKNSLKELKLKVAAQRVFFISMILALLLGAVFPGNKIATALLIILGLVIGALNITAKEVKMFLLAAAVLVLTFSTFYALPLGGAFIKGILENILYLVSPAAALVAFGVFYELASSR